MKFTVLACASLFCIVTFFHYREIQKRLENNFLRYDDHLNFVEKGVGRLLYGKEGKSFLLTLVEDVWMPLPKNCVLKVWEPLSLTLKLLSALVFKNTRAMHLYSSLTFHGLGTCMLYLSIMKILSFLRRQSFQNAAITWITVILFSLSPNRVEVFAWASAIGYSHSFFFLSVSLFSYLKWKESHEKSALWHMCFAGGYICAILSKSVSIPFIIIPTLLDLAMGEKMPSITKCVWRIIAAVAGIYLTFWANKQERHGAQVQAKEFPSMEKFLTVAFASASFYFHQMLPMGERCIHYFFENSTTISRQGPGNNCFIWVPNFEELLIPVVVVSCFFVIIASISKFCSQIKIFCLFIISSLALLSPAVLLSSLDTHAGTPHIRYLHLCELLVVVPTISIASAVVLSQSRLLTFAYVGLACSLCYGYVEYGLQREYHKWQNTEVLWHHALAKNENDYIALHGLAESYSNACSHDASRCDDAYLSMAEHYMKKSIYLHSSSAALYNMAILQWQRKQIGNVVHFLKRYLLTIPNDPEAISKLIEACSLIDDAECILNNIHYAMNIVEYSAVSQLLYQSATSLRRRGYKSDSTEIISIHKHALNVTGEEASVHFQWGTFLHGGGHHNLAVVHYKSALRRLEANNITDLPLYSMVLNNYGDALKRQKMLEQATSSFSKVLEYFPENKDAHYGLGTIALKQRDYKRAQRLLKKVITIDEKDVGALWAFGNAVYFDEEPLTKTLSEDAIDAFLKVMNLDKSLFDHAEKKIKEITARVEEGR